MHVSLYGSMLRFRWPQREFALISGFNTAFESVKNLVKPLVGYGDEGGERRFDINERTKVYFDIEVDGVYEGRINLELFDEIVPRTTENFRQLCTRKQLGQLLSMPWFKNIRYQKN